MPEEPSAEDDAQEPSAQAEAQDPPAIKAYVESLEKKETPEKQVVELSDDDGEAAVPSSRLLQKTCRTYKKPYLKVIQDAVFKGKP